MSATEDERCDVCGKVGDEFADCDVEDCPKRAAIPERRAVVLNLFIDASRKRPEALADASNLELPARGDDLQDVDQSQSVDLVLDDVEPGDPAFDEMEVVDVDELDDVGGTLVDASIELPRRDPPSVFGRALSTLRGGLARDRDLAEYPEPTVARPRPIERNVTTTETPRRRATPPPVPRPQLHADRTLELPSLADSWEALWDYATMLLPIGGALLVVLLAAATWLAPESPFLFYLFILVPLAVVLRLGGFSRAEFGRTVGSPFFLGNLVLGALIAASWSLEQTRSSVLSLSGNDVRFEALEDDRDAIALDACRTLARELGDDPSQMALLIESARRDTLVRCLPTLPEGKARTNAGAYLSFRFQRQLAAPERDEPTCADAEILRQVARDDDRTLPAMWECVTEATNPDVRRCCADSVRLLSAFRGMDPIDTLELVPPSAPLTEWLMAASFAQADALDETDESLTTELDVRTREARNATLRLACHPALRNDSRVLARANAAVKAQCVRVKRKMTSVEWAEICKAIAESGSDNLCGSDVAAPRKEEQPAPTVLDRPVRSDFD